MFFVEALQNVFVDAPGFHEIDQKIFQRSECRLFM
jgi:GTPase Era involved in 16S rRNA processing